MDEAYRYYRSKNRKWFNLEIPLTIFIRRIFSGFSGSQILAVYVAHKALYTQYGSSERGHKYFASMEQIAKYANCKRGAASKYTNILINIGFLERTFLGSNKNDMKSEYRLTQLTNEVLEKAKMKTVLEANKIKSKEVKKELKERIDVDENQKLGAGLDLKLLPTLKKVDYQRDDCLEEKNKKISDFLNSMSVEDREAIEKNKYGA
jgi:hypothetical protein